MYSKNIVKARKRAKLKRSFYINLIIFIPTALFLLGINVGLINTDVPWSMILIMPWLIILAIHRLLLFKFPQKTIFSNDYLDYQIEKEYRLLEFEDDMDEMELHQIDNGSLDLKSIEEIKYSKSGIRDSDLV